MKSRSKDLVCNLRDLLLIVCVRCPHPVLSVYFRRTFYFAPAISKRICHQPTPLFSFQGDTKNDLEQEEDIIKGSVVSSELGWMAERLMECPGLFVQGPLTDAHSLEN